MRIRPALADEADALTALCRRSKGAWGYDADFMAASAAALTVRREAIEAGRVFVAEDGGILVGVASYEFLETPGEVELDLLFVGPGVMRGGVGRVLLSHVAETAAGAGARRMIILADPHAAGFYDRCGAVQIGEAPSDAIPGRVLPLFEMTLGTPK